MKVVRHQPEDSHMPATASVIVPGGLKQPFRRVGLHERLGSLGSRAHREEV